jgi:hypothetical protein
VLLIEDFRELYFSEIASIVFFIYMLLLRYFLRLSSNKSIFCFDKSSISFFIFSIIFVAFLSLSFSLSSSWFLVLIKSVCKSTSFSSKEFKSRLAFIKTSKDASSAVIIA